MGAAGRGPLQGVMGVRRNYGELEGGMPGIKGIMGVVGCMVCRGAYLVVLRTLRPKD